MKESYFLNIKLKSLNKFFLLIDKLTKLLKFQSYVVTEFFFKIKKNLRSF